MLVPLYGDEPELAANLRAHCTQDHPDYEVVFGARDAADPALAVARRVAAAFPGRARAVVAAGAALRNPKVTTLAALVAGTRGAAVVIVDSDVRFTPQTLRGLVAPLADPAVGAATALYRGAPLDGAVARFGAAAIDEQFVPSVLVALALEPLRYCFGAAIAVRRSTLERIGGFAAIGAHLADDFALGRLVTQAGERVALAAPIVATAVTERSLGALWSREVRWARTTLAVRPASYAGLALTYPVPLALLALALARRRRVPLLLLAAAVTLRLALGAAARRALATDRRAPHPLATVGRDLFGFAVWAAAFATRRVRWRGDAFTVERRDAWTG